MTPIPQITAVPRSMTAYGDAQNADQVALLQPSRLGKDGRSLSAASNMGGASVRSYATTMNAPPASFSSELRSITSRSETPRPDLGTYASYIDEDPGATTERRQAELRDKIDKETKIKVGSENLLEALNTKSAKQAKEQKARVEAELNQSNRKLAQLKLGLEAEILRAREAPPPASRLSFLFRKGPSRSASRRPESDDEEEEEEETESPTFALAEILQALEQDAMQSDYYVERANALVNLLKRHPTLKYDLAWSVFGLRMQIMLLSDSREVVAAAYRVLRHAIADKKSLQTIRGLHTDYLAILAMVKDSKTSVEREQALKFVRAFLDVKGGVTEISRAVVRVIVAVAEQSEDRLRNMAILTLSEILIRDPPLLVAAGGIGTLSDALGEASYHAAESLTGAFLYLLDVPSRRKYLRNGHELEMPFASFTDSQAALATEKKLEANARVIAALMRSWPGLLTLCMNDFLSIRSLISAVCIPTPEVRNVLLDLLFHILRIKPPSWTSSFLAGRRLTTYGRVTNMKNDVAQSTVADANGNADKRSLVDHYTAILLAVLVHCGLVQALLHAEGDAFTQQLKRKTTLLLTEVLKMAHEMLPDSWSARLQVLPGLMRTAASFGQVGQDERFIAIGTIYQVDSVNRTLYRSGPGSVQGPKSMSNTTTDSSNRQTDASKAQNTQQMDEAQFRAIMIESGVLNTVNYVKWRWEVIMNIIEGPLLNPKRLDEAMKAQKWVHRVVGFYRPFKYRFSEVKNTKPNQRYVRAGVALMRTLLQNPEGAKYLAESKLIRQLAECLAHFDRMSGLTSESPLFTIDKISETLTGGYFAMLGALSREPQGMQILERWKVINMFYHIVELHGRDDLIRALLSNMDYSLHGHLRIIISKAMTSCSKEIRIIATRLLRKYATKPIQGGDNKSSETELAEWAIRLLVTQLYDPDIEVCEVAIKILEEACNERYSLEYIVKCRPALDHLAEIGAPLLLRFLSTSVGYHYLDGLDYITKEMDDWFLGRNDSYVALVEASLARAFADVPEKPSATFSDDLPEQQDHGIVPPHFYRELTRTDEGCRLLEQKGHFDEFAATIADFAMEADDNEIILKVKGCLWAVGNVGSMDLGAPFLERTDVVKWIVKIAEESQVMTLRGTACFVLGLISRSLHGQEILNEYGWDGAVNVMGESLGFCIPLDFRKLFTVSIWSRQCKSQR